MTNLLRLSALLALSLPFHVFAAEDSMSAAWSLQFEADNSQMSSNVVQKPNDGTADRFDSVRFTGGAALLGRLSISHTVDWLRSGSRLAMDVVPLQQSGTASPLNPLRFDGTRFAAANPLNVLYQFNTYRFTFDVPVLRDLNSATWEFRVGGTVAIRDAQIRLKQAGLRNNFINYGPVPLAYGLVSWRAADTVRVEGDIQGFPAPGGGGLLDVSGRVVWTPRRDAGLFVGARYLTGGAVGNDFYNFLHQRSLLTGIRIGF
jgi:hypothetical protein